MPGPQPLPISLIVSLFNNMPNIPGSNISGPNIQMPNMPSVNAPSVYGPNIDGPYISSSGIQGPTFQGPQFQGPSYNGPTLPGQGYTSSADRSSDQKGKYAGFWLGVLIFVWVLAFAFLILLGFHLAGYNVNPFNYQRFKSVDVMTAFTADGVEVGQPTPFGSTGGFGTQQVPFVYVDGYNFTVPSSGATGSGGIISFNNRDEFDKAKKYLSDTSRTGAIPYHIYTRDNIIVYVNVSSDTKAKTYETALNKAKS